MDVDVSVSGLLLSYIDHGGLAMFSRVDSDEPPSPVRAKWVGQLQDNNAWITDFRGGYTESWVDKQMVGTVNDDLTGIAKLRELSFRTKQGRLVSARVYDSAGSTVREA